MVRYGIKGAVGGGAATMQAGPITGYRDAAARAGKELALGEDLQLGLHFHLAKTREQAIREITPIHEERVKMFAPLGFVPGLAAREILSPRIHAVRVSPIFWRGPGGQGRRR